MKSEREKLIRISNDLRAQLMAGERKRESERQSDKVQVYKQVAESTIIEANLKESKLD